MKNNIVLAVDNQISLTVVDRLKQDYPVVLWAGNKPDEQWIEEALDLGANCFISPDLDISIYLDREAPDALWIDVPQNLPKQKQYHYLINKLRKIS